MGTKIKYSKDPINEISKDILKCLLEMVGDDEWIEVWLIEDYLTGKYWEKYRGCERFFKKLKKSFDILKSDDMIICVDDKLCDKSDKIKMTFTEVWKYYWSKYNDRYNQ